MQVRYFLIAIVILFLVSCSYKKFKNRAGLERKVALFIEMPKNVTVFENIGPLVYDAFWKHFRRVGFKLGTKTNKDYRLKIKIRNLEYPERFSSPDVVPYVFKIRIEIECTLFDANDKLLVLRNFSFLKWLSRAKDPVLDKTYLLEQIRDLLEKSAPRVDQFLRPFIFPDQSEPDQSEPDQSGKAK